MPFTIRWQVQPQSKSIGMDKEQKLIHLLYVPTIICNLDCSYCYLGDQIHNGSVKIDAERALKTLGYALEKFTAADVIPFNLSLHGGEVTVLPEEILGQLFRYINDHYKKYKPILSKAGFKKDNPHIKTNLYNFHKLYDLFVENQVSVSASIDLPLSLHDKHRVNKGGNSTLKQTLNNLKLLADYPHGKKFSSVICLDHYHRIDEIIQDIWFIHHEIGFDMNRFNFMFGFESALNMEKHGDASDQMMEEINTLTHEQQVDFYNRMKTEFQGTELEKGLNSLWFEEFTPAFCTNSVNCGEKFFLLQGDGAIYSCVRGQGVEEFYYGNIFTDSVEEILNNGVARIKKIHGEAGMHEDCSGCNSLKLCNTGCPFVKFQEKKAKSYTCDLQRVLYKDLGFDQALEGVSREQYLEEYYYQNHPQKIFELDPMKKDQGLLITQEQPIEEDQHDLIPIIEADEILKELYSDNNFELLLDGNPVALKSQVLRTAGQKYFTGEGTTLELKIKSSVFDVSCDERIRCTLYIMLLRDTPVVYGDEKRTKQEHVVTYEVFSNMLKGTLNQGYLSFDLMPLLTINRHHFIDGICNNMFFTTNYMREYHYKKQKNNAYYHIQAMNLPFPNFEFYWIE